MALTSQRNSAADVLVEKILGRAHIAGRKELEAWKKPKKKLRELASLDYVRVVRRTLDYRTLCAIIDEVRDIWPDLNRKQFRPRPLPHLAAISSDLHIHLQAAPYPGSEGMALRGFYVDKAPKVLKRPLIYLNTAHHPGAVQATFLHEIGHHMAEKVIGSASSGVHYFFDAAHRNHLGQPAELAADVVVSLAAYPQPLARRMFATPWNWGLVARVDSLPDREFAQIREHVRKLLRIDFGASLPLGQSFTYLAGMIHYAKLRWALLVEYDL